MKLESYELKCSSGMNAWVSIVTFQTESEIQGLREQCPQRWGKVKILMMHITIKK